MWGGVRDSEEVRILYVVRSEGFRVKDLKEAEGVAGEAWGQGTCWRCHVPLR